MMRSITLLALFLPTLALANLHQAPPNLSLNGEAGVFVDFKSSRSTIEYDINQRVAKAKTVIEFEQPSSGYPIFDLVPSPASVKINGMLVNTSETTMNGVSRVRYVQSRLEAGTHTLEVENTIQKNVVFSGDSVKSAFWMSDLSDRRYIEQYLPANLEYDQYQSIIEYKIVGTSTEHIIYSNGQVQNVANNHFIVTYPEVYTASSYFFHLMPKGAIPVETTTYRSIDGRDIPVTIYTEQSISKFMNETLKVLAELEADYGPWPHAQVIVYGAGSGGMEHCGATITEFRALGHELIHSYFARGVMPAHGNSGWVDEAIASWRDAYYSTYTSRSLQRSTMAGHSVYQRTTDMGAYSKGMRFIGYLQSLLGEQESFKVFLRRFFEDYKFKPFKTEEFKAAIEQFYNRSLEDEFNRYIYGQTTESKGSEDTENPYHPKLTEKQLLELL